MLNVSPIKYFNLNEMGDKPVFPETLKGFGYAFDEGGKLRKLDPKTGHPTEDGFVFEVTKDQAYNKKRYDAISKILILYVYDLLEKEGLIEYTVPKYSVEKPTYFTAEGEALKSFVFTTTDIFRNDKVIILIHGSGLIRAGQWSRRLILNDNLNSGTQLPYIRKACELGYAVVILNTNDNWRTENNEKIIIPGSEDPYQHLQTVWNDYIKPSKAKFIAIVAHSQGGDCAVKFAVENTEDFEKRIFAVALSDSTHAFPILARNIKHLLKVTRNWVTSKKPLDNPEHTRYGEIKKYSAGHTIPEMTPWSSMASIFRFIEEQYNNATANSNV